LPLQREYEGLLFHFLKHFLIYADAVLYAAIDAGYAVPHQPPPRLYRESLLQGDIPLD